MSRRRTATFLATLVFADEPQLIALSSFNARLIAVAIPENGDQNAPFLAVTVTKKDWEQYFDGRVDLRYLFTYPATRSFFTFDLSEVSSNKLKMERYESHIPEAWLPAPRFFSSNHTEDYEIPIATSTSEKLYIDGEWGLPDFGRFYNSYSDLYYFTTAVEQFSDELRDHQHRRAVLDTFIARTFRGGFSYVNLFDALASNTDRKDRLSVDQVQYASPGHVTVLGNATAFVEVHALISNYLEKRSEIKALYSSFHGQLSKHGFLEVAATNFDKDHPLSATILENTWQLSRLINLPHENVVFHLTEENPLAFAKTVLALCRRLGETAKFFAQGRMSFS